MCFWYASFSFVWDIVIYIYIYIYASVCTLFNTILSRWIYNIYANKEHTLERAHNYAQHGFCDTFPIKMSMVVSYVLVGFVDEDDR